jgi:hypothetical protein
MSYTEKFPVGSRIGIVGREFLEEFKRSWKYHYRFGAPSWNARAQSPQSAEWVFITEAMCFILRAGETAKRNS